jgi:hypothetical protein
VTTSWFFVPTSLAFVEVGQPARTAPTTDSDDVQREPLPGLTLRLTGVRPRSGFVDLVSADVVYERPEGS